MLGFKVLINGIKYETESNKKKCNFDVIEWYNNWSKKKRLKKWSDLKRGSVF